MLMRKESRFVHTHARARAHARTHALCGHNFQFFFYVKPRGT